MTIKGVVVAALPAAAGGNEFASWEGRIVVEGGETLQVNTGGANIHVQVSGYLFA